MSVENQERWFVLRITNAGSLDEDEITAVLTAAEMGANSVFQGTGVAIPYAAKVGPEIRAFEEGSR